MNQFGPIIFLDIKLYILKQIIDYHLKASSRPSIFLLELSTAHWWKFKINPSIWFLICIRTHKNMVSDVIMQHRGFQRYDNAVDGNDIWWTWGNWIQ